MGLPATQAFVVPGRLESLAAIRDYVRQAAAAAGLERRAAYRLSLAVDEIATNIITHGYQEAGLTGDIAVGALTSEEALTVTLEDSGRHYNPLEAPPPADLTAPLEARPVGGLGIYLAAGGVDRLLYERAGDKNRHIFVMLRKGAT